VDLIENTFQKKWNYNQFVGFDWNAQAGLSFKFKIAIGVLTETNLDLALAFAKFIQANPFIRTHLLTEEIRPEWEGLQVFPGQ
jgi:glycerophosphoryl diester phosphodiesterase